MSGTGERERARRECPADRASRPAADRVAHPTSDPASRPAPTLACRPPEGPAGAANGVGRPPLWRLDRRPLDYRAAWALQRDLLRRRQAGEIPDVLLLTEHPPVFTLGRRARREHLLFDASRPGALPAGAEVIETDRGGEVTFHGPGQLVAYPIVALSAWKKDVRAWLRLLEAAVIRAAAEFGVPAGRRPGLTGVWRLPDANEGREDGEGAGRPPRKLAAIGVRVSRWVTSHGVAVNANTDLRWFDRIVPCGLRGAATTSLAAELGRPVEMARLADALAAAVAAELGRELRPAPTERFPGGSAAPGPKDAAPALPPARPGPGALPRRRERGGRRPDTPAATAA